MSFDKTPTTWLSGYTSDGTDISLPIANISELSAIEAAADTGDIREIVFAILEMLYQAKAAKANVDLPANMRISCSKSFDSNGDENRTYTVGFTLANTGIMVKDES
jgi:hypothetical protein